ncbi:MAG: hypothetical protein OXC11_00890 [Rhodospirillales bacterium]|nr:hypothetical protein [Rhodospirillales bacterium]
MEDNLNYAELFTRAVTSLPEAVRQRLDGDSPLDWRALGDPGTGLEVGDAARDHRRLPEAVEALVGRLAEDVGIIPADVAAGVQLEGSAAGWYWRITIEPDGEGYRMRNRRSGEVQSGFRPEAVAGYAMLSLDLATAVHETCERWIEAGDRYRRAPGDKSDPLALCAIRMSGRLRSAPLPGSTRSRAGILEDAWNSQNVGTRAELSTAIRSSTAPDVCPPRRCYFAPINGYRLHAFDLGEVRWLRALAKRAATETPGEERSDAPERTGDRATQSESDPDQLALGRELAELERAANRLPGPAGATPAERATADPASGDEAASLDMTALEVQIRAESTGALELGSDPGELVLEEELASLKRAVQVLPGAIRRRLGEIYGIGVAQALARLRDPQEADAVYDEMRAATSARHAPPPLKDLAGSLLLDAGAQTRESSRTESLRLDPAEVPDSGYLATEVKTGIHGHLTLHGVVEQLHLGLTFACGAWAGLTTLESAGKEARWTLGETAGGNGELAASEREMLEAAQQIGHALDRIRPAIARSDRAPSALEQASMAADALTRVGPTVRAATGWPGAGEAPNPRDPKDVARIAVVAEALLEDIKSTSNRLIARRMTGSRSSEETQDA